jgi:hypothetical protein
MHLVTYHGVLAPSAGRREEIVPVTLPGRKDGKQGTGETVSLPAPEGTGLGTVAALVQPGTGKLESGGSAEREREREREYVEPFRWRRRYSWAELMKRVWMIDVLTCPECRGRRRLLAFILRPSAIERILSHLGLPTEPPKMHPARASPEQQELGFAE